MPPVDILVATYNGARWIDAQLQSLLKQTYSNIHITIRDDESSDETPQLLREWAKRHPNKITVISTSENLGLLTNFSTLLTASAAPYVMLCDQDDIWLPEKVKKTLTTMQHLEQQYRNTTPLLVHTDLAVVNNNLDPIAPSLWKHSHLNPVDGANLHRLLVQNTVTGCTVMVNRPLLNYALPIPNDCAMHDHWLALIASALGTIGVVEEATILYRQHAANDTGAVKYTTRGLIQRLTKSGTLARLQDNSRRRQKQAKILLDRHKALLPQKYSSLIEDYLFFKTGSLSQRITLMKKRDFKKTGFLRTLKELIF